jgi:hypothetical protein
VDANRIVQKAPVELSERIFSTNLIILSGQGIDVILGMSWMKLHKTVNVTEPPREGFVARINLSDSR